MSDLYSVYAKRASYFMTAFNLISGVINTVMGIYVLDFLQMPCGIVTIIAGIVLLLGIIKENANLVLVYLIIEIVLFTFGTICGLLLMIVLVYISAQIVDGSKGLNLGKTFIVDKYLAGLIAITVFIIIVISWVVHFFMYIYYDDLKAKHRMQSQIVEDTTVRYDVINNEGNEENSKKSKVTFLNANESRV